MKKLFINKTNELKEWIECYDRKWNLFVGLSLTIISTIILILINNLTNI